MVTKRQTWFIQGIIIGIVLLIFFEKIFILPDIQLGPVSIINLADGPTLNFSNIHIHHYVFGIVILLLNWKFGHKLDVKHRYWLYGIGAIMVLDELSLVIRGGPFFEYQLL